MSYKTFIYQKTGPLGNITPNQPAVDNAIDIQLAGELGEVCANINNDQEVKVVIITGASEKSFALGVDPCGHSLMFGTEWPVVIQLSVAAPVANLSCPVIGAINGDALGQGLELALACDLRIAVDIAHFAMFNIASGLIPWDGATQRLPRLVGAAKAMEMLLTGQIINAEEARRIGLINRMVRCEELLPIVMDMGQKMASKAFWALRYTKEAVIKGLDLALEQGLRLEADLYVLLHTTEDRTEGIRAFLEKRAPQFKDR